MVEFERFRNYPDVVHRSIQRLLHKQREIEVNEFILYGMNDVAAEFKLDTSVAAFKSRRGWYDVFLDKSYELDDEERWFKVASQVVLPSGIRRLEIEDAGEERSGYEEVCQRLNLPVAVLRFGIDQFGYSAAILCAPFGFSPTSALEVLHTAVREKLRPPPQFLI